MGVQRGPEKIDECPPPQKNDSSLIFVNFYIKSNVHGINKIPFNCGIQDSHDRVSILQILLGKSCQKLPGKNQTEFDTIHRNENKLLIDSKSVCIHAE